MHSASSTEGQFPTLPYGDMSSGYGLGMGGFGSTPSSASSELFAFRRDARDPREPLLPDVLNPQQLLGPGIPGPSGQARHTRSAGDSGWSAQHAPYASAARPSTMPMGELYGLAARGRNPPPSIPPPDAVLTLAPVTSELSPSGSRAGQPALAPFRSLDLGRHTAGPRSISPLDLPFRGLPPPMVRQEHPASRPSLYIPPPFTLQPQPQWDDPAFSPFNPRRRSPPPLPVPQLGLPAYPQDPGPSTSGAPSRSPRGSPVRARTSHRFDPVRAAGSRGGSPLSSTKRGAYDPDDPSTSREYYKY